MGEPLRIPHPVDELELSAYYDGALDHPDIGKVATHVAHCSRCQARLDEYSRLGEALRADEVSPPPDRLDARVGALLDGRRGSAVPWRAPVYPRTFVPALAAAVLVVLLAAYYFGLPLAGGLPFGPVGPAVAEAFPCRDAAECAVAVRFSGTVDHATIERSLQVDPPVPVVLSWQGDTLLVKPAQPLRPAQTYTVSLQVDSSNTPARPTPTPIAVEILASSPGSPVAVVSPTVPPTAPTATRTPPSLSPTAVAPSPSPSRTSLPQVEPIVPAVPPATPTPSSTAVPPPTPPATATPCAVSVPNPVGVGGPSGALSHLGCLVGSPTKLELTIQRFDHGRLIERPDRRLIIAAFTDGTWNSYPDPWAGTLFSAASPRPGSFEKLLQLNPKLGEALGAPIGPATRSAGSIADFERGVVIRLADREIDVFEVGAKWGVYPVEAVPVVLPSATSPTEVPTGTATTVPTAVLTPSPSATSTQVASPTATSVPTATPTASATVSATPSPTASASATVTPTSTATVCPTASARAEPSATPSDQSRAGCGSTEGSLSPIPLVTEASPTATGTATPHS